MKKEEAKLGYSLILCGSLENTCAKHNEFITKEKHTLEEWLNKKAEPNLMDIERKSLNNRSKWEGFAEFTKKKKIMLRHLKQRALK